MTDERGVGERQERAKRNRVLTYYAVLVLLGGTVGFVFATYQSDTPAWAGGNIPPLVAIVLAVVTAGAMLGGCVFMKRRIDEVEFQNNLYASGWATVAMMAGYPVWYLLWKGQLVPEPSHQIIFVAFYIVMLAAYLIRKFR
jgi:hypothetical protein